MRAIKCDRCGAFEARGEILYSTPYDGQLSFMHYDSERHSWEHHDLCANCRNELETWWANKVGLVYEDEKAKEAKEKQDEVDNIMIKDMGISTRGINILSRIGYITLGDVRKHLTLSLLRKCRNCGSKVEKEIIDALKEYNIEIPEGEEPKPIDLLPFNGSEEN